MTGPLSGISAKSALYQLERQQGRGAAAKDNDVLLGRLNGSDFNRSNSFFSIQSSFKSERTVFRALGEGLAKATGAIASARAGAGAVEGVLGKVDSFIDAVEAGAPASGFKATLNGLGQELNQAVARGGYAGTNLLKEGESLNITIGFNAKGGDYDFRELNFQSVGLSPTDSQKSAVREVQVTVTETVETPVTLADRLTSRVERLTNRVERLETRETRIESRLEKLSAREERLTSRLERVDTLSTQLTEKLEAHNAYVYGTTDKEKADAAKLNDKAADFAAKGNAKNAEKFAAKATETLRGASADDVLSPERVERIEKRLERLSTRSDRIESRLQQVEERTTLFTERLANVGERKEILSERLANVTGRLENLTEEQANRVVGTVTETVEKTVTKTVGGEASGSFEDILGKVAEKLAAGDTEGARALVGEARSRVERLGNQLDFISGSIERQTGFFGELTNRLDTTVKEKVVTGLDEESASRAAAALIGDLSKLSRLFKDDDSRPGIVKLYEDGKLAPAEKSED